MDKEIKPQYLNDDEIEIRVFSKDPIEQKQLKLMNKKILLRGIKSIENTEKRNK